MDYGDQQRKHKKLIKKEKNILYMERNDTKIKRQMMANMKKKFKNKKYKSRPLRLRTFGFY